MSSQALSQAELERFVADTANRAFVLRIADQVITEIAPEEVPLLRTAGEQILDAAVHQQADVAELGDVMGGVGWVGDILSIVVVQIVLNVTAQMLYDAAKSTFRLWSEARSSTGPEEIRDKVNGATPAKVGRRRRKVIQVIQSSLMQNLLGQTDSGISGDSNPPTRPRNAMIE